MSLSLLRALPFVAEPTRFADHSAMKRPGIVAHRRPVRAPILGLECRRRRAGAALVPLEALGEAMQVGVANALRLDLGDRRQHVIRIGPRAAMPLSHVMELLIE